MPLHPDAEPVVALMGGYFPDLGGTVRDADEARAIMAAGAAERPRPDVARVRDRTIPGPDGTDLPVRIYWPLDATGPLPVVVYFHGGGWVLGDLDSHDGATRSLANGAGAVVVAVHYRLAPENPFPAAAEDAHAALRWTAEHAAELGGDPRRLAVAGDSAGGNLAAVASLLARRRGGPRPAFQLLVYPVTDHDFHTESYRDSGPDCVLTAQHMIWFWDQYAPDPADRDLALAAPLREPDLSGLPPAHVLTAGRDPLRSEGRLYAQRLREAGVPTSVQHCPGLFHGFVLVAERIPVAREAVRRAHAVLAEALR